MAERFNFSQAGKSPGAPSWAMDMLLEPGSGFGYTRDQGKRRGQVRSEFIDPLGMLNEGSEKYGLSAWGDMFGDRGEIQDRNALLRSLNFGNVVGAEGAQGFGGSGGSSHHGLPYLPTRGQHGNSPNMGELDYFTDDYMDFRGWDKGIPKDVFFGENAAKRYEKAKGKSPFKSDLHRWLYESSFKGKERGSRWGRERNDVSGYWYDPNRIRFTEQDIAGVNTLEDLDSWAMENYGVDAQTLSAMNDELLSTREEFTKNPDLWWKDGFLDVTGDISGLHDIDTQSRLQLIMGEMDRRRDEQRNSTGREVTGLLTDASSADPHLGRSSWGQALAAMAGEQLGAPNRLPGLGQQGVGYDYGLASAFNPILQQLQEGQYRYGA